MDCLPTNLTPDNPIRIVFRPLAAFTTSEWARFDCVHLHISWNSPDWARRILSNIYNRRHYLQFDKATVSVLSALVPVIFIVQARLVGKVAGDPAGPAGPAGPGSPFVPFTDTGVAPFMEMVTSVEEPQRTVVPVDVVKEIQLCAGVCASANEESKRRLSNVFN